MAPNGASTKSGSAQTVALRASTTSDIMLASGFCRLEFLGEYIMPATRTAGLIFSSAAIAAAPEIATQLASQSTAAAQPQLSITVAQLSHPDASTVDAAIRQATQQLGRKPTFSEVAAVLIQAAQPTTPGAGHLTIPPADASLVQPDLENANPAISYEDAKGTNQDVTIILRGSGLYVSYWETDAISHGNYCNPTANFLENNRQINTIGDPFCAAPGDEWYAWWTPKENFPNGASLCNTWTGGGIKGKPCETIKS